MFFMLEAKFEDTSVSNFSYFVRPLSTAPLCKIIKTARIVWII